MFALCYTPPGNITKEIYALKSAVFRKTGAASVLALPPVIVLVETDAVLDWNRVQDILSLKGTRFETGDFCRFHASSFLSVAMDPPLPDPSDLPEHKLSETPVFAFSGFHFGCDEDFARRGVNGPEDTDIHPPGLSWQAGTVEMLDISVHTDDSEWWRNVRIESVWSHKVRK